ncbi:hypothetical protein D5266_07085 [bacterium c-19]|nr:hypothetical protein [bacterium c-19]
MFSNKGLLHKRLISSKKRLSIGMRDLLQSSLMRNYIWRMKMEKFKWICCSVCGNKTRPEINMLVYMQANENVI